MRHAIDREKCGKCPFYRKRKFLIRERCDFPMEPVPRSCPIMGGPAVLSWDDAMKSEIVWMERRDSGEITMLVPAEMGGVMCGITAGVTYNMGDIAPRRGDGIEYRFWDGRPTPEQMEAVSWNGDA